LLREVEPGHRWCRACVGERLRDFGVAEPPAGLERDDAAVLGAAGAQQTGQSPGVDAGDRDDALVREVLWQRAAGAEARRLQRQLADDESGRVHARGFGVLVVDADVADMRVRQRDDLPAVARVGQDFLVTGQRGIENDLADAAAGGADRNAGEDRTVGEHEQGRRPRGLMPEWRQNGLRGSRAQHRPGPNLEKGSRRTPRAASCARRGAGAKDQKGDYKLARCAVRAAAIGGALSTTPVSGLISPGEVGAAIAARCRLQFVARGPRGARTPRARESARKSAASARCERHPYTPGDRTEDP
jgi:hypothetical protein